MLFLANRQLDVQKIEGIKQIASLKQQIGDLQTRLDELQHAHQATLNELTRRSGEYDSLSNAYSQMLSEKKDLQQQLEQTMNSYKNMNLQVQDQITESNKEKCEMKMELDKLRKTYNELLAELQNTKTKHELEIEHLRQQLKDNQQQSNEEVQRLLKRLKELQYHNENILKTIEQTEEINRVLKSKNDMLVQSLEAKETERSTRLQELNSNYFKLQQQLRDLEQKYHFLSEENANLQQIKDRLQKKFGTYLETAEKTKSQQISRLVINSKYLQEIIKQQECEIQTLTQKVFQFEGTRRLRQFHDDFTAKRRQIVSL
jgi:chromosome segregation ATPase